MPLAEPPSKSPRIADMAPGRWAAPAKDYWTMADGVAAPPELKNYWHLLTDDGDAPGWL